MKKALPLSYILLAASFLTCDGMEKIREIVGKNWAKACALVSSSPKASKYLKPFIPLTAYPAYRLAAASLARNQKTLGDRPAQVQADADVAFEYNKSASDKDWLYAGRWGYGLMNLEEEALFKQLANKNSREKDVYIIDAGCAQGGWGREALSILQNETFKKSGKRFHIFSITGGHECDERIEHKDHVTLYQFNTFKIENIDEELAKRGFNLKNKVNLIVSDWTLRHTVDPFGTVKRMYGLLTPEQGTLMSNGFLFKYNEKDKVQTFPWRNEHIFTASNATCLFKNHRLGRDAGQFLLMRNDKKELNIPLEYDGKTHFIGPRWQNASQKVTVFNKGNAIKRKIDSIFMDKDNIDNMYHGLYCDRYDQRCQALYKALLEQKLFYE